MVTVRFFAAARAAAGKSEMKLELSTLGDLREFCYRQSQEFGALVESCTFLVDGIAESDLSRTLIGVMNIDILPKFAGG